MSHPRLKKRSLSTCPSKCAAAILFCVILLLEITSNVYAQTPKKNDLLINVVTPISNQKILPDTWPLPGPTSTKLTLAACPGELEAASFVIRQNGKNLTALTIKIPDLKGASGQISSENIDIKIVKVWYRSKNAWFSHRSSRGTTLVPQLLLNDDSLVRVDEMTETNYLKLSFPGGTRYVSISSPAESETRHKIYDNDKFPVLDSTTLLPVDLQMNKNKQFWATVRVPKKTSAGVYAGNVLLQIDKKTIASIPLELTVFPFELEKPKAEYSIFYRGKLKKGQGTISGEYKNKEQLTAELKNMWDHGVKNPNVYQPPTDMALLEQYLSIRQSIGMSGQPLYYCGIETKDPENPKAVQQYMQQSKNVAALAKKYGATKLYVYGIDESGPEGIRKQITVWRLLQGVGTGIFEAGWTEGNFELAGDALDIFIDGEGATLKKERADKWHSKGKKIFSYNSPQVGVANPFVYRKNYGLKVWQNNYDGVMDYAYQDGFGDIWNDFDHPRFRDHCFAFPTINGVVDTLPWEAFREGVDDARYIATLEKLVESVEQNKMNSKQAEMVKNAKLFLSDLKKYTGDNLDQMRNTTVFHILNLIK